jgi:hypothetical protein
MNPVDGRGRSKVYSVRSSGRQASRRERKTGRGRRQTEERRCAADLTDAAVAVIARASGFVTYDELNKVLPLSRCRQNKSKT